MEAKIGTAPHDNNGQQHKNKAVPQFAFSLHSHIQALLVTAVNDDMPHSAAIEQSASTLSTQPGKHAMV